MYDTLQIVDGRSFKEFYLIAGQGKIIKIGQGFKNTHNRYGDTDFSTIQAWLTGLVFRVIYQNAEPLRVLANRWMSKIGLFLSSFLRDMAKERIKEFLPQSAKNINIETLYQEGDFW